MVQREGDVRAEVNRGFSAIGREARSISEGPGDCAPKILVVDDEQEILNFTTRSADGSDSHVSERVLPQFLAELDGVEELKGVLVIDPAVLRPGRFDQVVGLPLPDERARREIFEVHLRGKPLASGVDSGKLAARTDGLSGADIAGICHQAALAAVRRVVKAAGDNPPDEEALRITIRDIRAALAAARAPGGETPGDEAEA